MKKDEAELEIELDIENPTTMEIMEGIIKTYNYQDTTGVVFFKNGLALHIDSFFDFFDEQWLEFRGLSSLPDKTAMRQFLINNNGAVITNGDVSVSLPDIMATAKETDGQIQMKLLNDSEGEDT